jgi:hypothetical protein
MFLSRIKVEHVLRLSRGAGESLCRRLCYVEASIAFLLCVSKEHGTFKIV